VHGSILIFQQTGHLFPSAFFVMTFISSLSEKFKSALEVIHNSEKSIFFVISLKLPYSKTIQFELLN
jgi:hypothetical protein